MTTHTECPKSPAVFTTHPTLPFPAELRVQILKYVLDGAQVDLDSSITRGDSSKHWAFSLLLVSKLFTSEVVPLLQRHATFHLALTNSSHTISLIRSHHVLRGIHRLVLPAESPACNQFTSPTLLLRSLRNLKQLDLQWNQPPANPPVMPGWTGPQACCYAYKARRYLDLYTYLQSRMGHPRLQTDKGADNLSSLVQHCRRRDIALTFGFTVGFTHQVQRVEARRCAAHEAYARGRAPRVEYVPASSREEVRVLVEVTKPWFREEAVVEEGDVDRWVEGGRLEGFEEMLEVRGWELLTRGGHVAPRDEIVELLGRWWRGVHVVSR